MAIGNDIGGIGVVVNTNQPVESKSHRQVYQATHVNGKSDSFMNRSFISFSFNGKNIEDFNLIACINGDRMERQLTGNFNDLVTSYNVVNGQYYWGTYFTNNQMSFTLSTDGITQVELDSFINWFAPGKTGELILAEHPNRAIIARIAEPPVLSVIPFEEKVEFSLDGSNVKTSTTLYKGDIQLSLIMDSPFWYSKLNILARGDRYSDALVNEWIDANNDPVSVVRSEDALKIIYEDGIPTVTEVNTFFIDNKVFLGEFESYRSEEGALTYDNVSSTDIRMKVGSARLGHVFKLGNNTGFSLSKDETAYLYYAGTAPESPILKFDYRLATSNNKIITPKNYNTITLTCTKEQKLLLGMPSAFYSYNQIVDLFRDTSIITFGAMKEKIREKVHHYYAKKWASTILNYIEDKYNNLEANRELLVNGMRYFLLDKNNELLTSTYTLDADSNSYIGLLGYRIAGNTLPANNNEWKTYGSINEKEEDISEIIRSKYFVLSERNHLDDNYEVKIWTTDDPTLSYKVTHDFDTGLQNFTITYKHKYY